MRGSKSHQKQNLGGGGKNEFRTLSQYRIFYCGTFQFYETTSKIITLKSLPSGCEPKIWKTGVRVTTVAVEKQ